MPAASLPRVVALGAVAALGIAACRSSIAPQDVVSPTLAASNVVHVEDPPRAIWRARGVASGLANPRGLLREDAGTLLVAEAGTGDPDAPNTGRLLRLHDLDGDGTFDERTVVLDRQPSINVVARLAVHRDEVFGFADVERGDGMILASVADPSEGTVVWRIDGTPRQFGSTADNANSLAWHPKLRRWFAVQSFANTVVDVGSGDIVASFPALEDGQDAVPAAIVHDPRDGSLLVALFSGQRGGDTAGDGVDFVARSGRIVRVRPETGVVTAVVTGLNAPVDLALARDGALFVLEFCDAFVDPVATLAEARTAATHGGFARFTGRVLRIDDVGAVVIAEHLDLPTHLLVEDDRVLVTVGQGTPGRTIPGPQGPTGIEGRVIELRPPARTSVDRAP